MAHELDMSNGRANIAYLGAKPWHGMGTIMQADMPIHEWAEAAGMGWNAIKVPAGYQVGTNADGSPNWVQEPGKWAVIRDDTFQPLGVFTDRYKIVQPTDVLQFFNDFVLTDDRFAMETAGCLKGGGVVWGLAKFRENMSVMGEDHCPYIMLTTSFDGSLATTAQATMIRVVCNNTLTASLWDKRAMVKVRHNTDWSEKTAAKAHAQLEQLASGFDSYKAMAEAMGVQRLARHQTEDFFKNLVVKEQEGEEEGELIISKRSQNILDGLMEALELTESEGTYKGTQWAAFNAVTRYVDHQRGTRKLNGEDEQASRMASSFFGSGATMKAKALELLAA